MRGVLFLVGLAWGTAIGGASAESCGIDFTVRITQGVGPIAPGTTLQGRADYTVQGRSIRQEGGTTAHLAHGRMALGDTISGPIWTLITTSNSPTADLMGVYARDVEGLSFAGTPFEGPMALTLFGRPGARPTPAPATTQAEWDRLDLRRAFTLHADGQDMLTGEVTDLRVLCR